VVIVITGPIASGKSTVARELARELERTGVRVAVIDLDLVHDELASGSHSDDATWTLARRRAADAANAFLEHGFAVVVAEGSFNAPSHRDAFAARLRPTDHPRYVTLQVSFEEALRRAQGDPTRGRSRDPGFLGPYFSAWQEHYSTAPATDIVIDTERTTATAAAATIARAVSR
jgi:adenylylsulfate kinase-like enzyme